MIKLKAFILSICGEIFAAWSYLWLCYHLKHAKKHGQRMEALIPDWEKITSPDNPSDEQ